MSQPSVSTMQLLTTSISPEASRASVASRSSIGVEPSICSARTPERDEFVADVDRVTDAGGKADGLSALAVFEPVADDVADQFRPVHAVGEFALDVVAVPDVNAMQIGIDRRIDAGRHQVALLDQLADMRALDHGLEDAAEPAAVATAWRGGEAEQDRVGIGVDDLAIGTRRTMVGLVDDDEPGLGQFHRAGLDGAAVQRLHAGDLHRLQRSRLVAGPDDAVRDAAQLGAGLGQDFAAVGEKQRAAILAAGLLDDGAGDHGFAAAVGATSRMRRCPASTARQNSAITSAWYGRSTSVMARPAIADAAFRHRGRCGWWRARSASRRLWRGR